MEPMKQQRVKFTDVAQNERHQDNTAVSSGAGGGRTEVNNESI